MAPAEQSTPICPECGASNLAGEAACFLCGCGLGTKAPASPEAGKPFNPYAPPTANSSMRPTFRISSLLLIIAVVAVCLGVWQAQPILGAFVAAIVVPALGYVCVIAFKSGSVGKPMAALEKMNSFAAAMLGVVVIEFAALVAFCMTCVPTGFMAMSAGGENGIIVAFVVGGLAAVAAGAYVTYWLITKKRFGAKRGRKP
jgi:hypothetical protein